MSMFIYICQTPPHFQFTKKWNNLNSGKVYLVVCGCLWFVVVLLVVSGHLVVVRGCLLMVCGCLLVDCGCLWLFTDGLRTFVGGFWLFFGGLWLFAGDLWSSAGSLWSFVGGLWSFMLVCDDLWSFVAVVCFGNYELALACVKMRTLY